jgi:WD40 repeat protein
LAVGDGDGSVLIYDTSDGDEVQGFGGLHDGAVTGLSFSDDGSRIASGGEDGSVFVIDADTAQLLPSPPAASVSPIRAVRWADDRLLSGGDDRIVRIWSDGALEGELGPHAGGVTSMGLAPDGTLAVGDLSGQVTFWDLDAQERLGPPLAVDDNAIWGIAWSPDGSTLAAALADEAVTFWDVESRSQVGAALTPQPGGALGLAYLDDDATIVTTSRTGAVRLWDVDDGVPIGEELRGHELAAWQAVALTDGRFATSSEDGTVRIWDVLDLRRACERAAGTLGIESLGPFLGEGQDPLACA